MLGLGTASVWGNGLINGTTESIEFNINFDDRAEAVLNTTGLGIGLSGPSANLHVQGNALVSEQFSVGGSSLGSSNLSLSGTMAFVPHSLSNNGVLDGLHSLVLADADTAGDNLYFSLPSATDHQGKIIKLKNTSATCQLSMLGIEVGEYGTLMEPMGAMEVLSDGSCGKSSANIRPEASAMSAPTTSSYGIPSTIPPAPMS